MSKLERLIQQYCPDGVEWKTIGEVCVVLTGGEAPDDAIKGKEPFGDCIYPIYSNGVGENALWGYASSYKIEKVSVTFSSIGTIGYPTIRKGYYTPIIRLKVIYPQDDSQLSVYYLKYALETVEFEKQKSSVPNINANMIKAISIPLPPLPVQEEIVRILDAFTELQAELQAELQKRKQQYNFYRDLLLSNMGNNAEHLTISEFAELKAGKAIKATELSSIMDDNHSHPCFGGNGIRGFIGKVSHIGDYAIIGRQGALCGCVNWASGKFYATEHAVVCTPRPNVSSRYLYHLFTVADLNQYKSQGAQPGLSVQRLNELVFPIPPLEEQNRIVAILDRFDTLTNDLTSGLPAEMEKRRQQYEFYRDKLLTFKRKEA